ncbi:MAG: DUF5686 family protein, partial [Gemmatimonadota bacterium]
LAALVALAAAHPAAARPHLVRGQVRAADTGEGLAAATLQIAGTYRGTVANDQGEYLLEVPELPARIRVTYIGYSSLEQVVADTAVTHLDFALAVSPYQMPETVVRPEEAARIMAEVIRRKQAWRPRIQRYRASAYSRYVVENPTRIALMGEIVSELYWDEAKGRREVVVSRRMTENSEGENEYMSALEGFVNLYDDDVPFIEQRLIGPTHPDALDHYDFRLVGRRLVDDRIVYDIEVRPKSRLQMAFTGRVAVLDGDYALLEADLTPSRASLASAMPIPLIERFDVGFRQQFRGFEGGVWLPVDYRMDAVFEIGMVGLQIPAIKLDLVTRLTEYEINVDLPDTLYASEKELQVDTLAVEADSGFARFPDPIPLTPREAEAYATIDSTFTPDKAFRPTGFLTRFMDLDEEEKGERRGEERHGVQVSAGAGSEGVEVEARTVGTAREDSAGARAAWRRYRPHLGWRLGYDRVSEGYLAATLLKDLPPRVRLRGEAGYHTGLERVGYRGEAIWGFGDRKASSVRLTGSDRLETRYASDTYPQLFNSVQAAVGLDDYFDYYWGRTAEVSAEHVARNPKVTARLAVRQEEVSSVEASADRDLLWRRHRFRPNPATPEGTLREVTARVSVGGEYVPFGAAANRRAEVRVDHGAGWLGSDRAYTRYQVAADWHVRTLWRRRWVPNALDLRGVAGTHTGDLPPERLMAVDVAMGPLSPFGALRAVHGHPYVGDRYAALFGEHNFRTTPFEYLGLWPLVQRGFGVAVHGAAARTWMAAERRQAAGYEPRLTEGTHQEAGVSLQAYHLFRVDYTRRLDRKGWSLGVGIARFDFE